MKLLAFKPSNIEEIKQLFTKVFSDAEGLSEGELTGSLTFDIMTGTDAQDLYGFVAIENKQIIGSILFTRLTFQNSVNAFLLSPVAIHTNYQEKGIGQKLISFGIDHLKKNKVCIVFTYGAPDFYSKVGFNQITEKRQKLLSNCLSQKDGLLNHWLVMKLNPLQVIHLAWKHLINLKFGKRFLIMTTIHNNQIKEMRFAHSSIKSVMFLNRSSF